MRAWLRRIKRIPFVAYILEVFKRFGNDNGPLIAAGLAFFLILGIVPTLLVGIGALGYYFALLHQSGDPVKVVQDLLRSQVLPSAAANEVNTLMADAHVGDTVRRIMATRGIAGWVGLAGVAWASMQVFLNAATAMNAVFEVKEKRGWLRLRLLAFGLLLGSAVMIVISISAIGYGSWIARHVPGSGWAINILTQVGALAIGTIMYGSVYHFLPCATTPWRVSFIGGFCAAFAWEVGTKGLSVYLLHPNTTLYGNLANLIILITWIYYSMMILLLGAEATAVADKAAARRKRARYNVRTAADGRRLPSAASHEV